MNDPVRQFAIAARAFCAWSEGEPGTPEGEVVAALRHLTELYQDALNLPDSFEDIDAPSIPDEEWAVVFRRFDVFPFKHYSECFNPHVVPGEKPVVSDIADDLADIWRDVKRGLVLYSCGHFDAAAWEWKENFRYHWGHHAVGAIYALHCWLAQNPDKITI